MNNFLNLFSNHYFLTNSLLPFFQIIIALCLGIILGAERTFAAKTAGMRTYGLVAMGSCLLIVTSQIVLQNVFGGAESGIDPLRLAAGIVTGIGFLGAGSIIVKDSSASGLTTAAGLWVASGIGIVVGFGLYALAMFTTFITLLVFTFLWTVEQKMKIVFKHQNPDADALPKKE